jgi:hypothetical protein
MTPARSKAPISFSTGRASAAVDDFRAVVHEFEAIVTDEAAISAFDGRVRLAPGTYLVTILHGTSVAHLMVRGPEVRLAEYYAHA